MDSETDQRTPEEAFRSSLEDLAAVAKKLAPVCNSTAELVELVELALRNKSQMRLLWKEVTGRTK